MIEGPLNGKRILLTRAANQMQELEQSVSRRGATPVLFPCLQVKSMPDNVRKAISCISDFSDVVFTSSNGVESVAASAEDLQAALRGKRIAAVGEATARALQDVGITADIVPTLASQDGLMHAYIEHGLPSGLMFFRASEGREHLAQALTTAGVHVATVAAYETVCPEGDASGVIKQLQHYGIDAVLLGSSKAARCYVQRILTAADIALADRPAIAVLSEQVKAAAIDAGLSVQVVAKRASFDSMLDELTAYFSNPEHL
ncbi:MAG TPA: uroporphyrinogen-III synthase [Mariprofundaceae bacterium]|nr:uroporphyrinogen-III synthase [Mariprofundaceae bacterium]